MPRKKKISNDMSEQLEGAVQEALEQLDPFSQLMNAGVEYEKEQQEEPQKRKRRTKTEMQAAREEEQNVKHDTPIIPCVGDSHITAVVDWDIDDNDVDMPNKIAIPDSILVDDYNSETVSDYITNTTGYCHKGFTLLWPEHHDDHDTFCEWEIEKAHLKDLEDPDFDYRRFYQQGDRVCLVRYYDTLKTKELIEVKLRTIYARSMVGVVDKQYCQCICLKDKDNIFYKRQDALDYFNSITAKTADEYNEETGKKKRKRKKTEIDEEDTSEAYNDTEESEEDDNE